MEENRLFRNTNNRDESACKQSMDEKINELKLMLKEVEIENSSGNSLENIVIKLNNLEVSDSDVIDAIIDANRDREKVLNLLAIKCFENRVFDFVIPFLKQAYKINDRNTDTLYNLGYVLKVFGENDMAISYLEKIENPDSEVSELIDNIKNGSNEL
ncbi:hypothetical protein [Acetivibrio cellulolyticus]|uniref:hypothetical protein n=1 Tax=Acetivibrio cellulolyticus TaxID=35830 RepID=UPI0002481B00|nr:hypothetical protein [Acetivibrio cellulolyticus]